MAKDIVFGLSFLLALAELAHASELLGMFIIPIIPFAIQGYIPEYQPLEQLRSLRKELCFGILIILVAETGDFYGFHPFAVFSSVLVIPTINQVVGPTHWGQLRVRGVAFNKVLLAGVLKAGYIFTRQSRGLAIFLLILALQGDIAECVPVEVTPSLVISTITTPSNDSSVVAPILSAEVSGFRPAEIILIIVGIVAMIAGVAGAIWGPCFRRRRDRGTLRMPHRPGHRTPHRQNRDSSRDRLSSSHLDEIEMQPVTNGGSSQRANGDFLASVRQTSSTDSVSSSGNSLRPEHSDRTSQYAPKSRVLSSIPDNSLSKYDHAENRGLGFSSMGGTFNGTPSRTVDQVDTDANTMDQHMTECTADRVDLELDRYMRTITSVAMDPTGTLGQLPELSVTGGCIEDHMVDIRRLIQEYGNDTAAEGPLGWVAVDALSLGGSTAVLNSNEIAQSSRGFDTGTAIAMSDAMEPGQRLSFAESTVADVTVSDTASSPLHESLVQSAYQESSNPVDSSKPSTEPLTGNITLPLLDGGHTLASDTIQGPPQTGADEGSQHSQDTKGMEDEDEDETPLSRFRTI
ncbi:hypothetical protein BJ170DRAFT_681497 [Xylariales sp. AK1849]|nr:hypothetical protein BJ170DRAFT_681497 [Xylariales sp. AK1849]